MTEPVKDEMYRFEQDFTAINCEIQNLKSENGNLMDSIKYKEGIEEKLKTEIKGTEKLIEYFENFVSDSDEEEKDD